MNEPANPQRTQRLARLRQMLAVRLTDPVEAIDALLGELEHGDLQTADWEALHVAAERDDQEVELGTAYQQLLTRPRLRRLDLPQQVRVLMHAADFFQGILGDADLARTFLQRVLESDPDHVEAFDRLERAFSTQGDTRGLIHLYALVARNPPLPPAHIAERAAKLISTLPEWMALSEDVCSRLLAVVPESTTLLDVICAHCQLTGRKHLAQALRHSGFYFRYSVPAETLAGEQNGPRPHRPTPTLTKVQIHGFAPSTYTRTARLTCIEKGVPYDLVPLDFRSELHEKLHPFLKMPVLIYGGVRLYETLAICSYVDRAFSGPQLTPHEPAEHARMLQWVSVAIDYLYRQLVVTLREDHPPSEERAKVQQSTALIEATLQNRRYLVGHELSLADLFVAPMVEFASNRGAVAPAPATRRWLDDLGERPSFRKTGI
jgi:glutathione S-transferase